MILKQNCFVISKDALKHFHNGTYIHRQKYETAGTLKVDENGDLISHEHGGLLSPLLEDIPVSYAGSSLQRKRGKIYDKTIEDIDLTPGSLSDEKDASKQVEHMFSRKSKIKIANKIIAWTRANKATKRNPIYNFITLTLTSPQIGTDKDFTKMLNVFFTNLRKYFQFKNYLYVLERQNKNTNNIHAHIIVDQYLPYERLNNVWCKILGDNGYTFPSQNYVTGEIDQINVNDAMSRYKASTKYLGEKGYINPKTNTFKKPTKNVNKPNPLDCETIYNIQTVSRYVTKYITKNDSKIFTSLWNCSQSISRLWVTAFINPQLYFTNLASQTSKILTLKLDNGYEMAVYLLNYYTKIQEQIFLLNNKIVL
jgi:hypothetical protein